MAALAAGYEFLLDAASHVDSGGRDSYFRTRPCGEGGAECAGINRTREADRGTIGLQLTVLREHVAAVGDELVSEYVTMGTPDPNSPFVQSES